MRKHILTVLLVIFLFPALSSANDYQSLFTLAENLSKSGVHTAGSFLALNSYLGVGVKRNEEKALTNFFSANTSPSPLVSVVLAAADYSESTYGENKWASIVKDADSGDASSQLALAWGFLSGKDFARDLYKSFNWYLKSAESGQVNALRQAALFSLFGLGTQQNTSNFRKYILQAAYNGDDEAQSLLGWLILNGKGFNKDVSAAFSWFKRSSSLSNSLGKALVGFSYEKGYGVDIDPIRARSYYELAKGAREVEISVEFFAEMAGHQVDSWALTRKVENEARLGDARAMKQLAHRYAKGLGCKKSMSTALDWLYKAGGIFVEAYSKEEALSVVDDINELSPRNILGTKLTNMIAEMNTINLAIQ